MIPCSTSGALDSTCSTAHGIKVPPRAFRAANSRRAEARKRPSIPCGVRHAIHATQRQGSGARSAACGKPSTLCQGAALLYGEGETP